jgi:hypothetical protein
VWADLRRSDSPLKVPATTFRIYHNPSYDEGDDVAPRISHLKLYVGFSSFHFWDKRIALKTNLPRNTGSQWTINILKNWLAKCNSKDHPACHVDIPYLAAKLPTRLIYLMKVDHIKLVLSSSLIEPCQYITLSHCWGDLKLTSLTNETAAQLFDAGGIEVTTLPQTFQDAISVCWRLGLRYLWIDSLCIQQDNEEDWAREAASMSSVYFNSFCNIAASAAQNASEGCFSDRDFNLHIPLHVAARWEDKTSSTGKVSLSEMHPLLPTPINWLQDMFASPLLKRGWVLQERVLSPRTVHYSQGQVFWECAHLKATEIFPEGMFPSSVFPEGFVSELYDSERLEKWSTFMGSQFYLRGHQSVIITNDDRFVSWMELIQLYTTCALSKERDKLPAVQGVADILVQAGCGRYCAGIWEDDFLRQLMWYLDDMQGVRPEIYRAPSWSWASIDGKISFQKLKDYSDWLNEEREEFMPLIGSNFSNEMDKYDRCTSKHLYFLEINSDPADSAAHRHWFLRIEAPIIGDLKLHLDMFGLNPSYMRGYKWDEGKEGQDAHDYNCGKLQVFAIELAYQYAHFADPPELIWLLIVPVSKGKFRRVGLCFGSFRLEINEPGELDWDEARADIPLSTSNLPRCFYESTRTISDPDWVDWRDRYDWDTGPGSYPLQTSLDKTTGRWKRHMGRPDHGPQGREVQLYTITII